MNREKKDMENRQIMGLVKEILKGSVKAMGRLITLIEYNSPGSIEALKKIYANTKGAYVVGFTGASGTGKSTLVDHVSVEVSKRGYSVGVIAIDPSSPFSGGALLGDRVRMKNNAKHDDIYVRSMGTRGSLGGLSQATASTVKVLDAFGKDFILIETSGTGQAEVDVIKETDTTVVVCVPGLGDEIQAMKAGIMEIGDIFVVNKTDLKYADRLVSEVEKVLCMGYETKEWFPPVIKTVATNGLGIEMLVEKIFSHRAYLIESGMLKIKQTRRIKQEIIEIAKNRIIQRFDKNEHSGRRLSKELLERIMDRDTDPYTVAEEIINRFGRDDAM